MGSIQNKLVVLAQQNGCGLVSVTQKRFRDEAAKLVQRGVFVLVDHELVVERKGKFHRAYPIIINTYRLVSGGAA